MVEYGYVWLRTVTYGYFCTRVGCTDPEPRAKARRAFCTRGTARRAVHKHGVKVTCFFLDRGNKRPDFFLQGL